jgi:hypothetical protein
MERPSPRPSLPKRGRGSLLRQAAKSCLLHRSPILSQARCSRSMLFGRRTSCDNGHVICRLPKDLRGGLTGVFRWKGQDGHLNAVGRARRRNRDEDHDVLDVRPCRQWRSLCGSGAGGCEQHGRGADNHRSHGIPSPMRKRPMNTASFNASQLACGVRRRVPLPGARLRSEVRPNDHNRFGIIGDSGAVAAGALPGSAAR